MLFITFDSYLGYMTRDKGLLWDGWPFLWGFWFWVSNIGWNWIIIGVMTVIAFHFEVLQCHGIVVLRFFIPDF